MIDVLKVIPADSAQTIPPSHQLAIDEAMLLAADQAISELSSSPGNVPNQERIRVWSFDQPVVVLGRSSQVDNEVHREFCQQHGIGIERRCSGGASVVGGPGCLMYSVVISHFDKPLLKQIDAAHRYVMDRVLAAVKQQLPDACQQGICDLTWKDRKFSGNSLRIAKHHLLYHGTVLHNFDLSLLANCLNLAPRQPDYRSGRDHGEFVTNVPVDPQVLQADLCQAFGVGDSDTTQSVSQTIYHEQAERLRAKRYDHNSWRFRH